MYAVHCALKQLRVYSSIVHHLIRFQRNPISLLQFHTSHSTRIMSTKSVSVAAASVSSTEVAVDSDPYTIREGLAIVRMPPKESATQHQQSSEDEEKSSKARSSRKSGGEEDEIRTEFGGEEVDGEDGQKVFYNKVQVFNRDLSILMIKTFVDERKAEFEARKAKYDAKVKAYEQALAQSQTNGTPAPHNPTSSNYVPPATFPGITILEALSATGLRSIRYFKEIGDVHSIIVNDMDADAVKSIEYNIALNGLTTEQLIPSHSDAITLMQKYRPPPIGPVKIPRPTVVDLDPYGTAAPFLDSAVQAVDEGGLLCVTCTDKAILCGNYSETCFAKYGSMPLKGSFCHETAVRLVLNCISSACIRYGRHMVPMLSMSIDFYVRVFVRVYTSALVVKKQAGNMGMILNCVGCESFWPHPMGKIKVENNVTKHTPNSFDPPLGPGSRCPECDSSLKMGGPFWLGPLHNKEWIAKALKKVEDKPSLFATSTRIIGSLTVCSEELQFGEDRMMVDRAKLNKARLAAEAAKSKAAAASSSTTSSSTTATPVKPAVLPGDDTHLSILFYSLPHMFQLVGTSCPRIAIIRSALINAGYQVSQSHALHCAIKTNAPNDVMWDIVRCWILENPPKNGQKPGSVGERIMSKAPKLKADFTIVPGTDLSSYATGVAKFLPNPEENWGPKARAGAKRKSNQPEDQVKRQKLNQGKRGRVRQCKSFADTGSCRFDTRCKFAHVPGAKGGEDVTDRLKESLSHGPDGGKDEDATNEKPPVEQIQEEDTKMDEK